MATETVLSALVILIPAQNHIKHTCLYIYIYTLKLSQHTNINTSNSALTLRLQ